ncbi:cellulose biosynthesis protein BcsD [Trinickia symbiotica]|nr:cellulose biosynthesis protein BcsD [Trinickia symbiotica]
MQTPLATTMLAFYASTHPSPQWQGFLTALAEEFESELDHAQLRQLMARIGQRFADAHPLGQCETIDDLATALNANWARLDWGFVRLADESDHLSLTHLCAPLAAFGPGADTWATAFLEGAYRRWLETLGADALTLKQVRAAGHTELEFRLAR